MKAIMQDRYGSPDDLEFGDVDPPVPGDDEVLVRVHAAAVNALDWHVMRGDPYLARPMMGLRAPRAKIRGRDFAGRVESVGRNVTRLKAGDEVFGEADGAFAEYVAAPEDVVAHKPARLTFEQAAAIPLAGNTALMGLRDLGQVQPGHRVLINGASGGVGTFAVQIAKAFGADVTGVCSTKNIEQALSLGADHVVDYTKDDFTTGTTRYDLIFDLVGNRSLIESRRMLTPTGKLVLSGGGVYRGGSIVGPMALMMTGMVLARFAHWVDVLQVEQRAANLTALAELAEAGKLTPVIDRTYPLGEAASAMRYLETEHARAKVVITVR
ncbi:NAD(P)-dependent alcohol dehydrogenase [Nocardia bhagyanarayanae]|uniref:NADPH:quinone reductase-like Zn-dependent oxidoreductase n=1 Tax=Nocardia bhagyanarayanae TaxID=1215925 RepID=A0A543FHW2_9NOCA|nr:NAD(P)-dependent alcohol dehydrogenase [Nocardia bhagyanarayanae]TQM33448.1 NADPH:quinone reductase-like Zn-dependent oxidoreductase [Nocardia bhagyanarayanae]